MLYSAFVGVVWFVFLVDYGFACQINKNVIFLLGKWTRMIGIPQKVRDLIHSWEKGKIFFLDDFTELGAPGAVRLALMQMAADGFIIRLARGIYCYPEIANEFGKHIIPGPESIAEALAIKERVRIIPYGDFAAKELGLWGLVTSDLKYLTDGAPRKIKLLTCNRTIYFNHTSEVKMFDYKNEKMQKIASAIRVLTEEMIDEDRRRILREHLREISEKDFNSDIIIPPAWVGKIMIEIRNE